MDQKLIETTLANLPLGGIVYYDSTGSTNDAAAEWAAKGVPEYSVFISDEQTRGRGRAGRQWFTPPGTALAFSLVLYPRPHESSEMISRFTGLGALGVCEGLENAYRLSPKIKWPNDVLLEGKKVCGVLAEAHWEGDSLKSIILGIGINVDPRSIPPEENLNFPAACIQDAVEERTDRLLILGSVLKRLIFWRENLTGDKFIQTWDEKLAYGGEQIALKNGGKPEMRGKLV